MRKKNKNSIKVLEIWICRQMKGRVHNVSKEEMLTRIEEGRTYLLIIKSRKENWSEHILRKNGLQQRFLNKQWKDRKCRVEDWCFWMIHNVGCCVKMKAQAWNRSNGEDGSSVSALPHSLSPYDDDKILYKKMYAVKTLYFIMYVTSFQFWTVSYWHTYVYVSTILIARQTQVEGSFKRSHLTL